MPQARVFVDKSIVSILANAVGRSPVLVQWPAFDWWPYGTPHSYFSHGTVPSHSRLYGMVEQERPRTDTIELVGLALLLLSLRFHTLLDAGGLIGCCYSTIFRRYSARGHETACCAGGLFSMIPVAPTCWMPPPLLWQPSGQRFDADDALPPCPAPRSTPTVSPSRLS